jgi:hypothetical protein
MYFLYLMNKEVLPLPKHKEEAQSAVKNTDTTSSLEVEAIRNRPFPLAGMGNDAGMETGDDIPPTNREPIRTTYYIGSNPVEGSNGIKIISNLSYVDSSMPKDFYPVYEQAPVANGNYVEIQFTLENTNKTPTQFNISNIRLLTEEQYEYFPIKQQRKCNKSYPSYTKEDEIIEEINPASFCTGKLLFDIATTTTPIQLRLNMF